MRYRSPETSLGGEILLQPTLPSSAGAPEYIVSPQKHVSAQFIREKRRGPIKTFLFPLVALTFYPAMVRSTIQSSRG